MVVFENEYKKTNTRSQTQKYLSLGKFTLAPLCEPHKIEIVQEKRQVTFIAIVVGRHESMPCLLAHNYLFSKPTGHSLTCGFCLLRNRANCRQSEIKRKAKELSTISKFASKKLIERNCNIMKDYGNGYSIEELAAKYRLSVRTCYRALDDAKQEARIQLAQVEDARKAEILAAYKNSVPLKEMIAKFNVAEGYCSMVANDAGLTENRRNERIKIRQKPRNENIFREYESGVPVQKLSEKYQLSVPGIYKVIQRVRRQKEAMSLAMDCEANQIERI